MSLPLERWARNAHIFDPTPPRVWEDLDELVRFERYRVERGWKQRMASLQGKPTAMPEGGFAGLVTQPPMTALAAVTGGTSNVAWWSPAVYTPLAANSVRPGQCYRLMAAGNVTSSSSAQTLVLNPAIGTAVAGAALGASSTLTLGSTITNAMWQLELDLTIRTVGAPGSNSTAIALCTFFYGTTAGASTTVTTAIFGLTSASFDATIAQGLLVAATPSAAGVSVTPQQVHFSSWN